MEPRTHSTRGTGDAAPSPPFKRRPPNPREQAKRKDWGKTWGGYLSRAAAELRKEAVK